MNLSEDGNFKGKFMITNNVSFSARVDRNTLKFLLNARENGLDTDRMENFLSEIYPTRVVRLKNVMDYYGNIVNRTLTVDSFEKKSKPIPIFDFGKTIQFTQETIDKITDSVIKLKYNQKKSNLEELVEKFGKPVN